LFVLLFFSSAFFPRETMSGAYRTIANWNPVSYLVEGFRSLTIGEIDATSAAQVVALPAALAVVTMSGALAALRSRTRRG